MSGPADSRKGPRVGVRRAVPAGVFQADGWSVNQVGERYRNYAIHVPEARGVRLHFRNFDVGAGSVWVHSGDPNGGQILGPYTGKGVFGDGEFWTEILFSDTVHLEFLPADGHSAGLPFEVDEIFQLTTDVTRRSVNTSCFLDAQCYTGHEHIGTLAETVAFIVTESGTCSGSLINDKHSTNTPYFLTAGHCIENARVARDAVFVFDFQTDRCGGSTALDWRRFAQVNGAQLLAWEDDDRFDTPDFAFLRLSGYPSGRWVSLGWTMRTPERSEALLAITHPRLLPQQFATLQFRDIISDSVMELIPVQGSLDKGSSGGSITDSELRLIGVNAYGRGVTEDISACDLSSQDRISGVTRFSAVYPRIREWLEGTDGGGESAAPAELTSPAPGSTLTGGVVTFRWNRVRATEYHLYIGDQGVESRNIFHQNVGDVQSVAVSSLPVDGRRVYVRLWSHLAGGWYYRDYTFTAATQRSDPAVITSPAPGSTLTGSTVTFQWTRVAPGEYHLYVGDQGMESRNIFNGNVGNVQSVTVSNLPVDGRRVYVRLWSHLADGWYYKDYTYTAAGGGEGVVTISVGQTVRGALTTSTRGRSTRCSDCYADFYQFTVNSSQTLVIAMNAISTLDPLLRVHDVNGRELASDDDGGGDLNARIVYHFPPGTYRIEATTYSPAETGGYILSLYRQ